MLSLQKRTGKGDEIDMASNVKVIPPKATIPETLRVAAYCRVSSDSADQLHSYAAQIRAYTELISGHDGWELVDVYADEGLTGTRMDKREDFNRMLADCRKGKIDKILVKTISRFARNIRDCLASLRELSSLGVAVYFEENNIDTETLATEFLVSVFGSLAQQESISISQNQRMSYQRRMERGEFITCKAPFGYRLRDGKVLEIIPDEAKEIQWMFDAYLDGHSMDWIAEQMTKKGVHTKDNKPYWQFSTILYTLTNEKYIGDTLCQKFYTTAFPFEKKKNHGKADQYYIENTHPAIVSKETFYKVQELLRRKGCRAKIMRQRYLLTGKVCCGICGTPFMRRESKNGLITWVCRKHNDKAADCPVGRIPESEIYTAFVRMYNKIKLHEGIILRPALHQMDDLNAALQRDDPAMLAVNKAIAQTAEQSHNLSRLQTAGLLDTDLCSAKQAALNAQLTQLRAERRRLLKHDDVEDTMDALKHTAEMIRCGPERLESFDEALFSDLVEQSIVESQTRIRFRLYGGLELAENLREVRR